MNDTTRELGGALGVAILGSLVTSRYTASLGPSIAGLPEQARGIADSGLSGALAVAERVGGPQGAALAEAAKSAFVDGLGLAAITGAVAVFIAAAAAYFLLPHGSDLPGAVAVAGPADLPSHTRADLPDESAAGDLVDDGYLEPQPLID